MKTNKTVYLNIRLSEKEKVEAVRKAEKNGLNVSAFVRMLIKKAK